MQKIKREKRHRGTRKSSITAGASYDKLNTVYHLRRLVAFIQQNGWHVHHIHEIYFKWTMLMMIMMTIMQSAVGTLQTEVKYKI